MGHLFEFTDQKEESGQKLSGKQVKPRNKFESLRYLVIKYETQWTPKLSFQSYKTSVSTISMIEKDSSCNLNKTEQNDVRLILQEMTMLPLSFHLCTVNQS